MSTNPNENEETTRRLQVEDMAHQHYDQFDNFDLVSVPGF